MMYYSGEWCWLMGKVMWATELNWTDVWVGAAGICEISASSFQF